MALNDKLCDELGDELYDAWKGNRTLAPLIERIPGITVDDAYRIQLRTIARRIEAGERHVGKKV
eukprot:gene2287-2868_t